MLGCSGRLADLCALAVGFLSTAALAADGVLEINQTCALSGCFPGDAAGFPVRITQPGSYRLTGDLQLQGLLSSPNVTVVEIQALDVTLDLGGFAIRGVTQCGGGLPVTSCAPTGTGVGVLGGGNVRVRNGVITRMGGDGINLFYNANIRDVRVSENGGDGIHTGDSATLRDVEVTANGGDGIDVGIEAVVSASLAYGNHEVGLRVRGGTVVDNVASRNGQQGANLGLATAFHGNQFVDNAGEEVAGGKATGGNVCADHTCTPQGRSGTTCRRTKRAVQRR